RHTRVAADQILARSIDAPTAAELHGRQAQALLKNVLRIWRYRASAHAADILMMQHRRREADEPAFGEDRLHHRYIRQMRTAPKRIVHEKELALFHAFSRKFLKYSPQRTAEGSQQKRDRIGQSDDFPVGIQKGRGG